MTDKQFPILGSKTIKSVPWSLLAPHERQAYSNHSQTLARLAERGGLGVSEALDVIEGLKWATTKPGPAADAKLLDYVTKHAE
jgi:hypothetical protein